MKHANQKPQTFCSLIALLTLFVLFTLWLCVPPIAFAADHTVPKQKLPTAFSSFDRNKDQALSADEFNAYQAHKFQKMDANNDKSVSLKEYKKHHKAKKLKMKKRWHKQEDKDS